MAEILLAKLLGPGGFERAVVVKRVLPHLARQREFREMFLDEAKIVARIQHPNVVHVSELGQEGRELFMVMEYLAGESVGGAMRRLTTREEPLDARIAAYVIAEAAAGLHAAHELRDEDGAPLGVVHRDVSPQNIFLGYDGSVKLLDFGIAKFQDRSVETHTGQVKGKFAYMSPEQCRADRLDRRSDVFSLGILLWELLSGARLFQRPNELLVWKAIVEEDIPTPSSRLAPGHPPIPAALEAVAMRALARDRDERYPDAAELRRDLLAALRTMDHDAPGADALAVVMKELFADRIAQKDEMLRRVRSGDVITSVPSAEVDVDVADLLDGTGSATFPTSRDDPSALPSIDTDPSAHALSAPARASHDPSWRLLVFGGLLLLAVIVGALLGVRWDRDGAIATASAPSTGVPAASTPAPSTAETAPVTPAIPSTPATVRLRVETSPPGAAVRVGAELRGVTPLDVDLARGETAVPIAISLEGYQDHVEAIVPDVDQRVRLTLDRERRRGARAATKTPADPAEPGFFRFD